MPSLVNPDKGQIGSDVARQGCLIGLATVGHHSWQFTRDLVSMNRPLNYYYSYSWIPNRPIDEAYNLLFDIAKEGNHEYIFLKEEDTIAPPHAWVRMLNKMRYNPDIFAITGVYPRKDGSDPTPFFYRGNGRGSYVDWKWGEFFEVTAIPFGCVVMRVSELVKLDEFVGEVEVEDHPHGGVNKIVKEYCKSDVWLDT